MRALELMRKLDSSRWQLYRRGDDGNYLYNIRDAVELARTALEMHVRWGLARTQRAKKRRQARKR